MASLEKVISSSLRSLGAEFSVNELAFLALTSKIELPFRDRWAYVMHKRLEGKGFSVAREWKKRDIAILHGKSPKLLIELGAMYTFDALRDGVLLHYGRNKILSDTEKANKLQSGATVYSVLLASHPLARVPDELKGVVAFSEGINRGLERCHDNEECVRVMARGRVGELFRENKFHVVQYGALHGGKAFGIGVDVLYWLVRV